MIALKKDRLEFILRCFLDVVLLVWSGEWFSYGWRMDIMACCTIVAGHKQ